MADGQYYGYPPPANSHWATIPLDCPIFYPDFGEPEQDSVNVVDDSPPLDIEWIPTNSSEASGLADRAVVAGHEGWDGSPLWVIRSVIDENQIIGKLAIKHNVAYVAHNGLEVEVSDVEVLCVEPNTVRWVQASRGFVPCGAVVGGNSADGEPYYIGRARQGRSITPGRVQVGRGCFISFSGREIRNTVYDVLCKII